MIEISQKEFEAKVQDIIDGKTTRANLIIELKIDRVTLNTKIQELAVYNPELYRAFVIKFPYRPREYTHIDYEAVIIDILKNGYKRRDWDAIYDVDSRTITRKIYEVEKTNPDLVTLYREVSMYRKKQTALPQYLIDRIEQLESKEIFLCDICDNKRAELLEMERKYTDAILKGKGAANASREVGKERASKSLDTLSRIDLERKIRKRIEEDNKGEK